MEVRERTLSCWEVRIYEIGRSGGKITEKFPGFLSWRELRWDRIALRFLGKSHLPLADVNQLMLSQEGVQALQTIVMQSGLSVDPVFDRELDRISATGMTQE